jgi:hypothetical protein
MANAERERISGVWGQGPQRRLRPEAESFLPFGHPMEATNLHNSLEFETHKTTGIQRIFALSFPNRRWSTMAPPIFHFRCTEAAPRS